MDSSLDLLCLDLSIHIIPNIDVSDRIDSKIDAEERRFGHRFHSTFLQVWIVGTCKSVLHASEITQPLNVGHVTNAGVWINSDDVAALAFLDKVQNDIITDPKQKNIALMPNLTRQMLLRPITH